MSIGWIVKVGGALPHEYEALEWLGARLPREVQEGFRGLWGDSKGVGGEWGRGVGYGGLDLRKVHKAYRGTAGQDAALWYLEEWVSRQDGLESEFLERWGVLPWVCRGNLSEKKLNTLQVNEAAKMLSVPARTLRAVIEVECIASGFQSDGLPVIHFSDWHFNQLALESVPCHYANAEWLKLRKALSINREAALLSTSWGMGQILGTYHDLAGYPQLNDFVSAMFHSELAQLKAVCAVIRSTGLVSSLETLNWKQFASVYNEDESYAQRLHLAYRKLKPLPYPPHPPLL